MKQIIFSLFAIAFLATGCDSEVCRNCEPINFNYESFDPTVNDNTLTFIRSTDGATIQFDRVTTTETPETMSCSRDVDEAVEIICTSAAETEWTSEDLGVDIQINFTEILGQRGVPTQVIENFSFKGRAFSAFLRTHAVVLQPEIVESADLVLVLDSLRVDGLLLTDVIEMRQPAEAFDALPELPDQGRYTRVDVKEGIGIVRLVDVDGTIYERDF